MAVEPVMEEVPAKLPIEGWTVKPDWAARKEF